MHKTFSLLAASAGFLGVSLGAFGAHALRSRLSPQMLGAFETAVHYQLVHALALWGTAMALPGLARLPLLVAGWSFCLGIALFSGSLYVLTLSGWRAVGMITPLGGLALLAGWASLIVAAWRSA